MEFLLLKQRENLVWECLCGPGKRAKIGTEFVFGDGQLECTVTDILDDGNRIVEFKCENNIYAVLDEMGGGGHLTMAACQIKVDDKEEAEYMLMSIIKKLRKKGILK